MGLTYTVDVSNTISRRYRRWARKDPKRAALVSSCQRAVKAAERYQGKCTGYRLYLAGNSMPQRRDESTAYWDGVCAGYVEAAELFEVGR